MVSELIVLGRSCPSLAIISFATFGKILKVVAKYQKCHKTFAGAYERRPFTGITLPSCCLLRKTEGLTVTQINS